MIAFEIYEMKCIININKIHIYRCKIVSSLQILNYKCWKRFQEFQ